MMDVIERPIGAETVHIAQLGWRDLERIAVPLCAPSAVYGHYAQFIEQTFTVSVAKACGSTVQVHLGGPQDASITQWLGLTRRAAAVLNAQPRTWIGDLAIFDSLTVHTRAVPLALVEPRGHPPRQLNAAVATFNVEFEARGDDVVVVSHRAAGYFHFTLSSAHVDGLEVEASYSDPALSGLRCVDCEGRTTVKWMLTIEGAPQFVDVVSLSGTPSRTKHERTRAAGSVM